MMTIGDIRDRDTGEKLLKLVGRAARTGGDFPNCVTDAVVGDEIIERLVSAGRRDDLVDSLVVAVSKKRRSRLSGKRLDMTGAVVLLVTAGFLVLLENACEIILGIESRDDAGLGM